MARPKGKYQYTTDSAGDPPSVAESPGEEEAVEATEEAEQDDDTRSARTESGRR